MFSLTPSFRISKLNSLKIPQNPRILDLGNPSRHLFAQIREAPATTTLQHLYQRIELLKTYLLMSILPRNSGDKFPGNSPAAATTTKHAISLSLLLSTQESSFPSGLMLESLCFSICRNEMGVSRSDSCWWCYPIPPYCSS
ncbi:hypothetical protein A4A49_26936 [Nicotiana attenuata]|uniref:Uncharacterized protein n=1 Tax=Nicotiana attenuata TaxID=49451 RepID=A0A1J6IAM0_NICAT|nr:hypothetical protein A4A49_26936 [Nicotiana attenuata]